MRSLFSGLGLMFSLAALLLGGCGVPNGSYGGAPTGDSGSPSGETIPGSSGGDGTSSMGHSGASCLEVYNAVSACYTVYYECAGPCENDDCAAACERDYVSCYENELALGSTVAQEQFGALRACEEAVYQGCYDEGLVIYNACAEDCTNDDCVQSCGAQANDVLQACMTTACASEYATCGIQVGPAVDDASGSEGGSTGGNNDGASGSGGTDQSFGCGELYECEDACNGNQACGQACYDQGTDQAQAQWTSLIQCGQSMCDGLVSNAAEYRECLQLYCSAQYNTCFTQSGPDSSGGSSSTGGNTCGEGYTCVQDCYVTSTSENGFYACVDGCYDSMSSEAMNLMTDLVACSNIQCADVPGSINNLYRCQEDFCPNEYNACMGHTPSGTSSTQPTGDGGHASCLEIHEGILAVCVPVHSECIGACSDDACAQACAQDMEICIDGQQAGAPAEAVENFQAMYGCRQTNYQSCYDDANTSFMSCMDTCDSSDTACQNACNAEAGEVYEDCFSNRCASEYAACGM